MSPRRKTLRTVVFGLGLAASVPLAGGDWRDARPNPHPDPRPETRRPCRTALQGHVERQVGNVHHGPPRDEGVPRIQVRLLDAGGGVVARTRTDRNGLYSFRGACAATTYTICPGIPCPTGGAAASRFSPETLSIEVPRADLVRGLDFMLLDPPQLGIDAPFPAH